MDSYGCMFLHSLCHETEVVSVMSSENPIGMLGLVTRTMLHRHARDASMNPERANINILDIRVEDSAQNRKIKDKEVM